MTCTRSPVRMMTSAAVLLIAVLLPASALADPGNPNFSPATNRLTIPVLNIDGEVGFVNVDLRMDFETQTFTILSLENVPRSPIRVRQQDEFRFDFPAKAGQTYVVELHDVARSFESARGAACDGSTRIGVGLAVTDPDGNLVAQECRPNGFGDTYTFVELEAGRAGRFEIEVKPNEIGIEGEFSVRVQPFHDDPGAKWDARTHEPNNRAASAFGLKLGQNRALASELEERNSSFSAVFPDFDWYRIDVTAGQDYVVEIFNVARGLESSRGALCDGSTRIGVGLVLLDPNLTRVADVCIPRGHGNVHNHLQFRAGLSGTHYVGVAPNGEGDGSYSVRALPEHGDPAAGWNRRSFEPNNRAVNAYAIELGARTRSEIEERNLSFATSSSDIDWYRIEAQAGTTYEIELSEVDPRLVESRGSGCDGSTRIGLGLVVADPDRTTILSQCSPQGVADAHNVLSFTAGVRGTHYIGVIPNGDEEFGRYALRVSER